MQQLVFPLVLTITFDHFFSRHGLRETDIHLHADNCAGQHKNNYFFSRGYAKHRNDYLLFSRGYAKHRNDYLLGGRLCKCVTNSDVNFWVIT